MGPTVSLLSLPGLVSLTSPHIRNIGRTVQPACMTSLLRRLYLGLEVSVDVICRRTEDCDLLNESLERVRVRRIMRQRN